MFIKFSIISIHVMIMTIIPSFNTIYKRCFNECIHSTFIKFWCISFFWRFPRHPEIFDAFVFVHRFLLSELNKRVRHTDSFQSQFISPHTDYTWTIINYIIHIITTFNISVKQFFLDDSILPSIPFWAHQQ
jgi:hypothetical protein